MNRKISNKSRAIFVGVLILVAYGILVSSLTQNKILVMLADVISGLAVMGTAFLMYPLFKDSNKPLSLSYLILKCVEGSLMILSGLFFLSTSSEYLREVIYENIHMYVFIISAFIFYYLLFKLEIVPKFISIWGAAGIVALLTSTLLHLANLNYPLIDYLLVLVITNEVFLAIWLMVKGFNRSAIESSKI